MFQNSFFFSVKDRPAEHYQKAPYVWAWGHLALHLRASSLTIMVSTVLFDGTSKLPVLLLRVMSLESIEKAHCTTNRQSGQRANGAQLNRGKGKTIIRVVFRISEFDIARLWVCL